MIQKWGISYQTCSYPIRCVCYTRQYAGMYSETGCSIIVSHDTEGWNIQSDVYAVHTLMVACIVPLAALYSVMYTHPHTGLYGDTGCFI